MIYHLKLTSIHDELHEKKFGFKEDRENTIPNHHYVRDDGFSSRFHGDLMTTSIIAPWTVRYHFNRVSVLDRELSILC